jgi:hypothetical protein
MKNLLGPLDEQLNHQTSRPFRVPATTDHRFYDRHWFELVAPGGEVAMIAGMGLFKNLGVADGFVSIQRDRLQRNIRVSRPLDDHVEAYVGPLRFEIIEPFQAIRLSLAEGDYPAACDLSWTSRFPARLEAAHLDLVDGRIVTDISRYDQSGTWTGWLRLGDDTFEADDWWGIRDHSWGVRPDIGGFEPSLGHRKSPMLWLWAFATTDTLECHFQMREDGSGNRQFLDGYVQRRDELDHGPVEVVDVQHDISFVDGTRDWNELTYRITLADGVKLTLTAEALHSAWAYRGTGYEGGFSDGRGVGVPRGHHIEHDVLDLRVPGEVSRGGQPYHPGHREQPARIIVDGRPGLGHLPVMSSGRIERYGLGRS